MPKSPPVPRAERQPAQPAVAAPSASAETVVPGQPDATRLDGRLDDSYAITRALSHRFPGGRRRAESAKRDEQPPRATIVATGIAAPESETPGIQRASAVEAQTGTVVVAEGGSSIGVEAMTQGLLWAISNKKIYQKPSFTASRLMHNVARDTLYEIIEDVHAERRPGEQYGDTSTQAIQLAGDSLVFIGPQPVLVYDRKSRTCTWVNQNRESYGAHKLEPGKSIIITSSGHTDYDAIPKPNTVARHVQSIINDVVSSRRPDSDSPPSERAGADAQQLAERLRAVFGHDGSNGTITVSFVEVADWEDTRGPARRFLDNARLSHIWYLEAARRRFHQHTAREIYESKTALKRNLWRAADAGVPLLALLAGWWATRMLLDSDSTQAATGVIHPAASPAALPSDHSPTDPAPLGSVPPESAPPTTPPDTTNTGSPELPVQRYTFSETYVASPHDMLNSGHASSVTGISRAIIRQLGEQMGLPESSITSLQADEGLIARANDAFMHDTRDTDNTLVLHDSRHFLDAGDSYSAVDQTTLLRDAALQEAHRIGLKIPGPTIIDHSDVTTSPPQEIIPTPQPSIDYVPQHARAESEWLRYAPIAAAAAVGGLALWYAVHLVRRRRPQHARAENADTASQLDPLATATVAPGPTAPTGAAASGVGQTPRRVTTDAAPTGRLYRAGQTPPPTPAAPVAEHHARSTTSVDLDPTPADYAATAAARRLRSRRSTTPPSDSPVPVQTAPTGPTRGRRRRTADDQPEPAQAPQIQTPTPAQPTAPASVPPAAATTDKPATTPAQQPSAATQLTTGTVTPRRVRYGDNSSPAAQPAGLGTSQPASSDDEAAPTPRPTRWDRIRAWATDPEVRRISRINRREGKAAKHPAW